MSLVVRKHVRMHQLLDGTYDLEDMAYLSDALAVSDENEYRAQKAAEQAANSR